MRITSALWLLASLFAACNAPQSPSPADGGFALDKLDASDPKSLLAAVDQMPAHLKDRPKTFEILVALGNLYYENGRYLDAVDAYRQALQKSAPAEAEEAALEAKGIKAAAELPLECRRSGAGYGLEQIAEVAKRLAASEPRKALRCYQEALGMALASRARRGNALYLIGNPDSALAEHEKVLQSEPDYPESLFFVGAILLEKSRTDPSQREPGKKMWRRLLEVAPDHPRAAVVKDNLPKVDELFAPPKADAGALPAGHPPMNAAQGELPAGHPPIGQPPAGPQEQGSGPTAEQVQGLAEAVKNTERTPEMEKQLDESLARGEELLDQGKFADARSALMQVMPFRTDDPRVSAALGGVMRNLGRAPMAERTLQRALQLDPKSPRANYEYGMLLLQRGDKAGARDYLTRAQADAAFASKHKVADELAKAQ